MNREIRFRAWDDYKKIIIPNYCYLDSELRFNGYDLTNNIHGIGAVMQYVGLKDRNGVEIYEGDIVKVPNTKRKAKNNPTYITKVIWGRTGFTLEHNDTYFNDYVCLNKSIEVIGNIFENPDLLKQQ